jgi:DtxR family transcriptional regulator, Mn-dependent transcriptional regulator
MAPATCRGAKRAAGGETLKPAQPVGILPMVVWTHAAEQENIDEYLESLYRMTDGKGLVKTAELAKEIEVTPASVTEMVQKLAAHGYVDYTPYKGVELTAKGRERARFILRNHRLIEMFLVKVVGVEKDKVHGYACAMEHTVPPELDRWLCAQLGHPARSMGGKEIPPGKCCPAGAADASL